MKQIFLAIIILTINLISCQKVGKNSSIVDTNRYLSDTIYVDIVDALPDTIQFYLSKNKLFVELGDIQTDTTYQIHLNSINNTKNILKYNGRIHTGSGGLTIKRSDNDKWPEYLEYPSNKSYLLEVSINTDGKKNAYERQIVWPKTEPSKDYAKVVLIANILER